MLSRNMKPLSSHVRQRCGQSQISHPATWMQERVAGVLTIELCYEMIRQTVVVNKKKEEGVAEAVRASSSSLAPVRGRRRRRRRRCSTSPASKSGLITNVLRGQSGLCVKVPNEASSQLVFCTEHSVVAAVCGGSAWVMGRC